MSDKEDFNKTLKGLKPIEIEPSQHKQILKEEVMKKHREEASKKTKQSPWLARTALVASVAIVGLSIFMIVKPVNRSESDKPLNWQEESSEIDESEAKEAEEKKQEKVEASTTPQQKTSIGNTADNSEVVMGEEPAGDTVEPEEVSPQQSTATVSFGGLGWTVASRNTVSYGYGGYSNQYTLTRGTARMTVDVISNKNQALSGVGGAVPADLYWIGSVTGSGLYAVNVTQASQDISRSNGDGKLQVSFTATYGQAGVTKPGIYVAVFLEDTNWTTNKDTLNNLKQFINSIRVNP